MNVAESGSEFPITVREGIINALNAAFPSMPLAVILTDPTGTVVEWNSYAEFLYGYSAQEAIGSGIEELTVGPVQRELAEHILSTLGEGRGWGGLFTCRRKDGSFVTVNVIDVPIVDDDGQVVGLAGLSREDASSYTDSLNELEELRRIAAQLDLVRVNTMREIAGRFHDELSQKFHLLTRKRHELLAREDLKPEVRKLILELAELGRDLEATVQGIWRSLRPPLLDEFGIVAALESLGDAIAALSGMVVDVEIDPEVNKVDSLIQEMVVLLVQEALANVVSHAEASTCSVSATVDGDILSLDITDDGVGIGTQGVRPGFGLGLMNERVRSLGGELHFEPGPNGGTSLLISLPAHQDPGVPRR